MTNKDKDLLFKELCARMPYGVKVQCEDYLFTFDENHMGIGLLYKDFNGNSLESLKIILSGCYYGENIKPYLFPFSSMTKEQKRKLIALAKYESKCEISCGFDSCGHYIDIVGEYEYEEGQESIILYPNSIAIDFCNKHHLDYRGLIEKGLAIDATNLNIY